MGWAVFVCMWDSETSANVASRLECCGAVNWSTGCRLLPNWDGDFVRRRLLVPLTMSKAEGGGKSLGKSIPKLDNDVQDLGSILCNDGHCGRGHDSQKMYCCGVRE